MSSMDQIVINQIKALDGKSPIRSGIADLLLPANEEQYIAMNKMAIVAVSVFGGNEAIPTAGVQILEKPGSADGNATKAEPIFFNLPSIFPMAPVLEIKSISPFTILGKFRQNVYVFAPIWLLQKSGTLIVKMPDKVDHIKLLELPVKMNLPFIQNDKQPSGPPDKLPEPHLVLQLLMKNYCVGLDT